MKQQFYSNKKFTCSIDKVEDGIYYLRDIDGVPFELIESRFKEYYVPVERMKEKPVKKKPSPFEEEFAKRLVEFGSLNSTEDATYISGTEDLVRNKAL